ncbi:histidine kinase [Dactylosporangium matsuzakiense]|uniref:histidine kinase n=2 Tax=Dactylosporangium matsuzakiense TaxID=53360 RepID=A0A9W6NN60_9ACTN|nr:histidine kinase [Dactylosporangium matsuzakiense]
MGMSYPRALARSLLLLALVPVVLVQLVATVVPAVVVLVHPGIAVRRLTGRWRAMFGRWLGREIPVPYAPEPGPPQPDEEGLYRHDSQLYRSPRVPAYLAKVDWFAKDPALARDVQWMALFPFVVLLIVPLGLPVAPWAVRAVAAWSACLLKPGPARKAGGRRTDRVLLAWARLGFLVVCAAVQLVLFGITLVLFTFGFGLGLIFLIPLGLTHMRWLLNLRRSYASWGGVTIERPYAPPREPELRPDGLFRVNNTLYKTENMAKFNAHWQWVWHDPASWRDLSFLVVDASVTGVIAGLPVVAGIYGAWGLALPWVWTQAFGAEWSRWYGAFFGDRTLGLLVGVGLVAAALAAAQPALRMVSSWTQGLLKPTAKEELRRRVERLTQTRADAVDAQAAEVRRIERDLHDGAQARLISVGLTLGAIERLMDTDPAKARQLVAQARETSQTALTELRDLVRGIHPPVLSERGLPDAVRALALDTAADVTVTGRLEGRLAAPVESAAYFAVSELLANAVRHGRAAAVTVDIRHVGGVLRIRVTDDGGGGADPSRGTGLRGIERRLGTFDGTLAMDSPAGGPTVASLELPCALFSPKTSTS